MPNIPTTTVTDSSQVMYPSGGGGKPVLVVGDAGFAKDTTELYTFNSYSEAIQSTTNGGIGPQPTDWEFPLTAAMRAENQLLAAIADIFNEGGQPSISNTLGIDTVYAVNIGSAPTADDFTAVFELTAPLGGLIVECYPNQSTVANLLLIASNLDGLESEGIDRVAVATGIIDATLSQLEAMTTPTVWLDMVKAPIIKAPAGPDTPNVGKEPVESGTPKIEPKMGALYGDTNDSGTANVIDSRLVIKDNPLTAAKTAAKIACTPYFQDPGYGPYRSMQPSELIYRPNSDLNTLTGAGIMCDWMGPNGPEICMAVSTGYVEVSGGRAADGLLHHRLNVDYQAAQVMGIIQQLVKQNNTSVANSLAQQAAESYLLNEQQNNRIEDYTITVTQTADTAYGLDVELSIMPEPATYFITVKRTVLAPTGGS